MNNPKDATDNVAPRPENNEDILPIEEPILSPADPVFLDKLLSEFDKSLSLDLASAISAPIIILKSLFSPAITLMN